VPERYVLSLTVDPSQPRFSGNVRILVHVPKATSYVVLNARGIEVTDAAAEASGERIHASATTRASAGGHEAEELLLTFDQELPVGDAVIDVSYDAPFGDSLAGLYRVNEGGRWYAFSQFESNDARRAFPCFDEPAYKVPFDVHVTAPTGLLAVSNMPEAGRTSVAQGTRFDFQTSPPLPTYLVAFVIGEFDVREGQKTPVPIRLLTTKGKTPLGTLALSDTAALTTELAEYFHIAYPYPKLDIVAVPNFAAGAMENAGLITFRDELLLLDPEHPPRDVRIAMAEVIAHELAHQWFGDLVTMAWWDDLWLNEGFATWAETKITEQWNPSFHAEETALANAGSLMTLDSLGSARAVRQPVRTTGEAEEAFDRLTYEKGALVLRMIEHLIGPEMFQRGVERYLRAHSWKNATSADLLSALTAVSGVDVAPIAASFLDRAGVPNLTIVVDCKAKPPQLSLTQAPWKSFGAATIPNEPPWLVPFDARSGPEEVKLLMKETTGTVALTKCPTALDANADGYGYYRYTLDEKAWTSLAANIESASVPMRLELLGNLWASVKSGAVSPDVLLRLLPRLDEDRARVVIDAEIEVLGAVSRQLVSPAALPAFLKYARARLAPHAKALDKLGPADVGGMSAADKEREGVLARSAIALALGALADDPTTLAEAGRASTGWLAHDGLVDDGPARVMVTLGSRKATGARITELRAAMKTAKNPYNRKTALYALGAFDDEALYEQAMNVLLTDEVPSGDVLEVIFDSIGRRSTRLLAFEWLTRHWDALKAKIPSFYAGEAFQLVGEACTRDEVKRFARFFDPKVSSVEGATGPYGEGLEGARLCTAMREHGSGAVDKFFGVKGK
jgi:alanyl aminopeptidase